MKIFFPRLLFFTFFRIFAASNKTIYYYYFTKNQCMYERLKDVHQWPVL